MSASKRARLNAKIVAAKENKTSTETPNPKAEEKVVAPILPVTDASVPNWSTAMRDVKIVRFVWGTTALRHMLIDYMGFRYVLKLFGVCKYFQHENVSEERWFGVGVRLLHTAFTSVDINFSPTSISPAMCLPLAIRTYWDDCLALTTVFYSLFLVTLETTDILTEERSMVKEVLASSAWVQSGIHIKDVVTWIKAMHSSILCVCCGTRATNVFNWSRSREFEQGKFSLTGPCCDRCEYQYGRRFKTGSLDDVSFLSSFSPAVIKECNFYITNSFNYRKMRRTNSQPAERVMTSYSLFHVNKGAEMYIFGPQCYAAIVAARKSIVAARKAGIRTSIASGYFINKVVAIAAAERKLKKLCRKPRVNWCDMGASRRQRGLNRKRRAK